MKHNPNLQYNVDEKFPKLAEIYGRRIRATEEKQEEEARWDGGNKKKNGQWGESKACK